MDRQRPIRNEILSNLVVADFARIRPYLQSVPLKKNTMLQDSSKRIDHVHFVEAGIVSLRTLATGSVVEVATVGYHGVVGASVALGAEMATHQAIVLVEGSALRIRRDDLLHAMSESPHIRERLLQYIQSLMIHISQTTLCGVRHELDRRLACWLSFACDALNSKILPITHDHLSTILGLRRASLTESLIRFEEEGLIAKDRGVVAILQHGLLKDKACGCYGVISGSYEMPRSLSANSSNRQPQ